MVVMEGGLRGVTSGVEMVDLGGVVVVVRRGFSRVGGGGGVDMGIGILTVMPSPIATTPPIPIPTASEKKKTEGGKRLIGANYSLLMLAA